MTTVLLVSQHTAKRHLLRAVLEEAGFTVQIAETGRAALGVLAASGADLIAADMLLPERDGYLLCLCCKHAPHLWRTPFVLFTTEPVDDSAAMWGLRLGASLVINPAIDAEAVVGQLCALLDKQAANSPGKHEDRESGALDDLTYYRLYTELLTRQLEEKNGELAEARHALRASEGAIKRSQEVAHVGHWTWDTRSNRVTWSDEMHRIFGLDPTNFDGDLDEIIRRSIHPDDLQSVLDANAAVIREQRPNPMGYRVIWPDGSVRYLWAAPVDKVMDEAGNIILLSGIIQDITERSQVSEELLHSLRRVAVASQVASLGFWEYDVKRDIEIWDDHMHTLYGVPRSEFEPTYAGWARWIHPQDLRRMAMDEAALLATSRRIHSRFRVLRPDGKLRHIEMYAEIERDAEGMPLRMTGVDRDVTDWVESEQRMQLQSAALAAAANAIVITTLDGTIEWINPAFTQLTGYSAEESLGRRLGDLMRSGLQNPSFYEQLWASILAGQVWQGSW